MVGCEALREALVVGNAFDISLLAYEQRFMAGQPFSIEDRRAVVTKAQETKDLIALAQKKVNGLKTWFKIVAE